MLDSALFSCALSRKPVIKNICRKLSINRQNIIPFYVDSKYEELLIEEELSKSVDHLRSLKA